ncbi:neocarzinostatin apoprotein domain-containing protein [Nocardia sp. NPDC050712]|uniref:neocarzinostatin apoprotein domain-containing protein n=1 Tax=Nocardia sp. NPDC050712 TaxID=3155518 RepID=UPI0033F0B41D
MRIRAPFVVLLAAAGLALTAPAASAAPTLQLNESSGLAPGQAVTISLDGLPPNLTTVAVGQCKPQITLPTDCQLAGSRMGKADDKGKWQALDGNNTLTLVSAIGDVDCTTGPGACVIAVTSLTQPGNLLASTPLAFGAKEAPKPAAAPAAAEPADEDSNTALFLGIGVAVVVVIAAGALLLRRRAR